jgi:cholesterol transport system auxiliary component
MTPHAACSPQRLAIKSIAANARIHWASGLFASFRRVRSLGRRFALLASVAVLATLGTLAGCSVIDKPKRAAMFDFGPGLLASQAAVRAAPLPAIAIDDIGTPGGALDNTAVHYRLAYSDTQQLRPYALARWSMPPAQLVRQRLKEQLGQRRVVFNAGDSASMNRSGTDKLPLLLRLDLEEFSQIFSAPQASTGALRLRATLVEITPGGEKLVGQRSFAVQQPAASADAEGGVLALTAATNAAIEEIDQWLQQNPAR